MSHVLTAIDQNLLNKVETLTGMTESEAEVALNTISKFTMSGFIKIKKIEREGGSDRDVEVVNNFIKKMPAYQGMLYRGIPFCKLEKLQAFLKNIQDNGGYAIDSMTSFTSDEYVAEDYASSRYPVMMRIKNNRSGISIREFSALYAESEVLVPKGTQYRVTHISEDIEDEEILYIDMEEI
jgi:hypothetical protein